MTENKNKLSDYLTTVVIVFNKNGPKITKNEQVNNYTEINNTQQYIDSFVKTFVNTLNDNQIEKALNDLDVLNQIVLLLIKKITKNDNEPIWSIVDSGNGYYFIPSEDAIKKYNISSDISFYNNNFKIQPPQPKSQQPQSFFKNFFSGGKKSKKRRPKLKNNYKKTKNKKSKIKNNKSKKIIIS